MMEYLQPADRPVVDGLEGHEVHFAKKQKEYRALRALRRTVHGVPVLSRWTLTEEQREAIARGADIFLELLTFGKPLQPITLMVSDGLNPEEVRIRLGLSHLPWPSPEIITVHEAGDMIRGVQKCVRCDQVLIDYNNAHVSTIDGHHFDGWKVGALVACGLGWQQLTALPLNPNEALCKE